jgi:hypothetical protein
MNGGNTEFSVPHALHKETTMSDSRFEENKENTQELSVRVLLEEEFKTVFGGTTPVTVPWAGLTFI